MMRHSIQRVASIHLLASKRTAGFNVGNFYAPAELPSSHSDFGNRRMTLPERILRFYECDDDRVRPYAIHSTSPQSQDR